MSILPNTYSHSLQAPLYKEKKAPLVRLNFTKFDTTVSTQISDHHNTTAFAVLPKKQPSPALNLLLFSILA